MLFWMKNVDFLLLMPRSGERTSSVHGGLGKKGAEECRQAYATY